MTRLQCRRQALARIADRINGQYLAILQGTVGNIDRIGKVARPLIGRNENQVMNVEVAGCRWSSWPE